MTNGEWFDSALKCSTREEAQAWLDAELTSGRYLGAGTDEAREIVLANLGYMAGYYGAETAKKIQDLFGAQHPLFGKDYFIERLPKILAENDKPENHVWGAWLAAMKEAKK
jgi:hypothetical protein